jgi:hypothetical protein
MAAIPPPPVSPRGPGSLILYCLLGVLSLAVVAISTSRIFSYRDRRET